MVPFDWGSDLFDVADLEFAPYWLLGTRLGSGGLFIFDRFQTSVNLQFFINMNENIMENGESDQYLSTSNSNMY